MYHKEKVDNMPILVIKTSIVSHYQHLRSEFFGVIVDGMEVSLLFDLFLILMILQGKAFENR